MNIFGSSDLGFENRNVLFCSFWLIFCLKHWMLTNKLIEKMCWTQIKMFSNIENK